MKILRRSKNMVDSGMSHEILRKFETLEARVEQLEQGVFSKVEGFLSGGDDSEETQAPASDTTSTEQTEAASSETTEDDSTTDSETAS